MSQTLSLEPGKYALFIVPPVAGVDYTGTPLPTVSYQWKKNGTAIAGQTNATISGVWVEQSGGTVDLVDGDVISIDIILTNLVSVATKTISATIDSAIPAPVISPVSIRQLSGGTYQTVTSLANTDIGEQVIVASNTGGTVTTTPPVLTTYQWRRGFAPLAGATNQTYTLQAADADSIIDCVVTATNSGGTTTATATVVVGTVADAGGWTALTPSADSRLIYVSNDGNDAAAANVYGRGYYLPSDEEIGADPTNPVAAVVAYQTLAAAYSRSRQSQPDWVLLRRGDVFQNNGALWDVRRGRSDSERSVLTAYGTVDVPRPTINGMNLRWWSSTAGFSFVSSLDLPQCNVLFFTTTGNNTVEDCRVTDPASAGIGVNVLNADPPQPVEFKRCVIEDGFSLSGLNQGMFIAAPIATILIEECVLDQNGYGEDPTDASTWTQLVGAAFTTPGLGVQPKRTTRDRNLYASSYEDLTLRGSIIARGGGGGSAQMRYGGICERNLFIWNEGAMGSSHPEANTAARKGTLVVSNVVLHDDPYVITGSGWGINAGGTASWDAVLHDNVLAHFHRGTDPAYFSFAINGKKPNASNPDTEGPSQLRYGVITDNVIFREYGGIGLVVEPTTSNWGVTAATVNGNAVAMSGVLAVQRDPTRPSGFTYGGNRYYSTSASFQFGTTVGTFGQWQAAGYDTDGSITTDFAAFKAAAGWTAPERDIVSYMQSVDPTYVVNEDVYVDDDAAVKQAVRQKVWEVLSNAAGGGVLSETRAKQVARRYHAFITFIQRAKENRKGAWDTRWTAEAVNNYIRAGFGKAPVAGAYDTRSLATRLAEFTP